MTPNDFGIIRQADHNLFSMLFPPLTDISEYEFEIIMPEYIDGYMLTSSTGVPYANPTMAYSVTDVSKYDYVLLFCGNNKVNNQYYSGLNENGLNEAFNYRSICIRAGAGATTDQTVWGLLQVDSYYKFACINVPNGAYMPIIGFRRHRSDGANPKGIINPIPEPDLDLKKEAPEQEEDLEEKEFPEEE